MNPAPKQIVQLRSEADTDRLGRLIADAAAAPLVLALEGPLGAGKTRLVQAIAAGLGVPAGEVTSPTFVLVNEYLGGRLPLYHFDAYRVADDDEFLQLGPEEYFEGAGGRAPGLCCVEWASRVERCLPPDRVGLAIDVLAGEARRVTIHDPTRRLPPLGV